MQLPISAIITGYRSEVQLIRSCGGGWSTRCRLIGTRLSIGLDVANARAGESPKVADGIGFAHPHITEKTPDCLHIG